jgi:formylglycine-generating enzyme required for sulfatase activity
VALVRLGHAERVWPLLVHSPDPRLRSFIVNWLKPLGADPTVVAAAFERLSSPAVIIALPAAPKMGQSLFHRETSMRRALILALGTYGSDGLSPGEREVLIARLLYLYQNDADPGIHGATEWTLRQWKQHEKLSAAQAGLRRLKENGARRWFTNGQGQTFAVIECPLEFRMGSPCGEPDREDDEIPHSRCIPRRFAISDKEVTVEQYQRFTKENSRFRLAESYLNKYSPDPRGPIIGVSWFDAAAYCDWLSKQEGLPQHQWCYLQNERVEYEAQKIIPAVALKRPGYRLPTEAEWEYACRAGSITSRYHGQSARLLEAYARCAATIGDAWPSGSLLPNDLGLFDMLGNVYEWCHERAGGYEARHILSVSDDIVDTQIMRVIRGGSFRNHPPGVRSANRDSQVPSFRGNLYGFRLARTYN